MGARTESGFSEAQSSATPVSNAASTRKRKLTPGPDSIADPYVKKAKKVKTTSAEKRLRRFRPKPPQNFAEVYNRATTQRFYVLSRTACGTPDCPAERVEITGSTGNIYTIVIDQHPSCNCPQGKGGKECKHVFFVLSRVLRAKFEYVYQLALLSTELQDIFANAPPPTGEGGGSAKNDKNKNRKPIEGDCPICFSEMETDGGESVVWCRAACGQNIHKECFEMWAATKRQQGSRVEVTCPYCRSVWEGDEDMVSKIKKTGKRNKEGYVNVAKELGISTVRDTSTYSPWWSGHTASYRRRS
ncbi:hypothetical protein B0T17DRAFT_150279 [Bombardia bombarda]|uniref:Uncharacterized protein n=1 Tax=Bombardia bombarda TaxID=252184 RepID=A0AA39X6R2_9PEZI|nr:hypothetical protein B0T17DRAFT_150279 [Bombardia bombarda]